MGRFDSKEDCFAKCRKSKRGVVELGGRAFLMHNLDAQDVQWLADALSEVYCEECDWLVL
jgi:hypothetical protein